MPDNKASGVLEDFISFLVPSGDILWPLAEDILVKVIEKDLRFSLTHKSKALVHTWLAWQKKPDTPIGRAITNRYFDANTPYAQQLMPWIRQVFKLEQI